MLQVGVPKELYERPRTRFVADFVGTNNLMPGRVADAPGRPRSWSRPRSGALEAIAPAAPAAERCVLAIRPENVGIAAGAGSPRPAPTRSAGRVALVSYLGNTLRYDVQTAAGPVLKADIRDPWHHEPLPPGAPVAVSFPASVTLAIADDTDAAAPA